MGRKIFVSYKYRDDDVKPLNSFAGATVRDYVTEFEKLLKYDDHVYKGEEDNEDLSQLTEDAIWSKLKDRIYDSSVTVVFISPNMKEKNKSDKEQWIPWEISYSLKETSRKNKNGDPITSKSNAMLGVVIPDRNGSYAYYLEDKTCCGSRCRVNYTERLFNILSKNMFNFKNPNKRVCLNSDTVWSGEHSYITVVKWDDFINDYDKYIEAACDRQSRIDEFEITKEI